MMELLPLALLTVIAGLLVVLAVIDARTGYLPDIFTLPLGVVCVAYHWSLGWSEHLLWELILAATVVACWLLIFRHVGNRIWGQESFGLGDVKLLVSSTMLLGFVDSIYAMAIGFSLCAGAAVVMACWRKQALKGFSLPLGPGLCAGVSIVLVVSSDFVWH